VSVTIGINGFGRIGRCLTRIVSAHPDAGVTIGAINDLATADRMAYGLRRDSLRGTFPGTVTARPDRLVVNDRSIRTFNHERPERIPWADAGVDVVIEATGRFRSGDVARRHITHGGARKVVISASADDPDAVLVYGANHQTYDALRHDVVSPASCGVNALTVMAKVLYERFGLHSVATSVVLALQGWEKVHDGLVGASRNDPRLGRAAGESIIPHNYVVGDLVRVAPVGSLAEITGRLDGPVPAEEINRAMAEAAAGQLRGVLAYDPDPTVSIDVKNNSASCLFDPSGTQTTADGGIKVRGWFDNEWGFSHRLLDLARLLGNHSARSAVVPVRHVSWSVF
jgi:glyceraldehyde 3-phosphate dehydrogenase